MDILVDIGFWFKGAIAVIGLLQTLKNFVKLPSKIWALLLVPLSIGFAWLPEFAQNGLGIAGMAQIGYETIIQVVKQKLESMKGKP